MNKSITKKRSSNNITLFIVIQYLCMMDPDNLSFHHPIWYL